MNNYKILELSSETPVVGKRYWWQTISDVVKGTRHEGVFEELDSNVALMRMDNGDLEAVEFFKN